MEDFGNKVVYQVYPKSFMDANGDGVGDLKGITGQLEYLKDLGIDYLWITPVFPSPQRDNGYDVADYVSIDLRFGTMEDMEELIAEGKKRGIGLMLDMVFNHTSTEHLWFKRALSGEKKYQDYYIFKEGTPEKPPTNWQSKFGGSAWEYVPSLEKWYLHLFDVTQADLNWDNPEVRDELKKVILFWKEKGIESFRFDVVNLISKPEVFTDDNKGDGRRFYSDGPHVHEYLQELTRDTGIAGCVTVGEMSSTSLKDCIAYSNPENQELSFVAENGAFVKDRTELVFTAEMPKETVDFVIDLCREYAEISNVLCGLESAYCERGTVSQEFFELTGVYYHRLQWVDDFKAVKDQILKFAPTVPEEKTYDYYAMFGQRLEGKLEATTSGHGSIDLIVPGCHKASGLKRLVKRWGIFPEQCAAFGDGGNDIEMLKYCGHSYAMANAPENVKQAAKQVCPSNEEDGVLVALERLLM
jgi:Cof subfamily protein (haloacid dehalogenase superfamily)